MLFFSQNGQFSSKMVRNGLEKCVFALKMRVLEGLWFKIDSKSAFLLFKWSFSRKWSKVDSKSVFPLLKWPIIFKNNYFFDKNTPLMIIELFSRIFRILIQKLSNFISGLNYRYLTFFLFLRRKLILLCISFKN